MHAGMRCKAFIVNVLNVLIHGHKPKGHFYKNFQGFTYCSVFKVLCFVVVVSCDSQITISQLHSLVNNCFKVFSNFISEHRTLSRRTLCLIFVVPDVRSTKLNAVSLRFENGLALSSRFAKARIH